ncbi:hypothetical protein FRC12_004979 [Ceratobasidium sp. 428]|nr:hypothetical protein FRC12_004979 [Ceratobasidium sp. 428]
MSNANINANRGPNDAESAQNQPIAGVNEGNPTVENPAEMELIPPNIQTPPMTAGEPSPANPVVDDLQPPAHAPALDLASNPGLDPTPGPGPILPGEENEVPPDEENQAAPAEDNEISPLMKGFAGKPGMSFHSH